MSFLLLYLGALLLCSCHKGEKYVCYLYKEEPDWITGELEASVIETFDSGWIKQKDKKEEDCETTRDRLQLSDEEKGIYDTNYWCSCDWEPQ